MQIQALINNEPAEALDSQMSRSHALFGELNLGVLQPPAETTAELLGFTMYAEGQGSNKAARGVLVE